MNDEPASDPIPADWAEPHSPTTPACDDPDLACLIDLVERMGPGGQTA